MKCFMKFQNKLKWSRKATSVLSDRKYIRMIGKRNCSVLEPDCSVTTAYLFSDLHSILWHWWIEINYNWSIFTFKWQIFSESQLLNIYQHSPGNRFLKWLRFGHINAVLPHNIFQFIHLFIPYASLRTYDIPKTVLLWHKNIVRKIY